MIPRQGDKKLGEEYHIGAFIFLQIIVGEENSDYQLSFLEQFKYYFLCFLIFRIMFRWDFIPFLKMNERSVHSSSG